MEPVTPTSVAKPRYAFVDLAKGICIMLVVWHHVVSTWGLETYPLKEAVSSFRMPLYFFLSGLFFKEYAGFFDFCKRKINKLLIPFAFFFVTLSCIFPFVLHYLLTFNSGLNIDPDPRISEWLKLAIGLPIGFGLGFQLPLVMFASFRSMAAPARVSATVSVE